VREYAVGKLQGQYSMLIYQPPIVFVQSARADTVTCTSPIGYRPVRP